MVSARNQYAYFENLEKTIKIALAIYVFLFLAGLISLAFGMSSSAIDYARRSPLQILLAAAAGAACYFLLFRRINRIQWIGELHIWLDRKIFGFLARSNEIIFQTLLFALPPAERDAAYELAQRDRESVAETIFSKLAGNKHLFPSLLRSGIFRLWIWYWVSNYGTALFSVLAVAAFPVLFVGTLGFAKLLFTLFWICALFHLAAGLWLGYRVLAMTKEVSEDIVKSYSGEIAAILRAQLATMRR